MTTQQMEAIREQAAAGLDYPECIHRARLGLTYAEHYMRLASEAKGIEEKTRLYDKAEESIDFAKAMIGPARRAAR